jgi:BolA family transcriptional regulator, general stress-responsive regulator
MENGNQVTRRIEATLRAALDPTRLEVIDDSHKHAGHAGAVPGKTTHVRIIVDAEEMRGLSRVERHRRINALLRSEIDQGLHALQILAGAPGERAEG